jgi:hypothetical protein
MHVPTEKRGAEVRAGSRGRKAQATSDPATCDPVGMRTPPDPPCSCELAGLVVPRSRDNQNLVVPVSAGSGAAVPGSRDSQVVPVSAGSGTAVPGSEDRDAKTDTRFSPARI